MFFKRTEQLRRSEKGFQQDFETLNLTELQRLSLKNPNRVQRNLKKAEECIENI